MSWLDWFRRSPGPKVVGKSPGGSRLLKYGGGDCDAGPLGEPDDDIGELQERREAVYEATFGTISFVSHELFPFVPHVDVYTIPPGPGREFFTFLTGGMSDLPMQSPKRLGPDYRRVELIFYAEADRPEYIGLLRNLAHFPHANATWIHWGHTMPNGTPPEPLFPNCSLDHLFFTSSPFPETDRQVAEQLVWKGEPVNLVWPIPITEAECAMKLEHGSEAFLDLLEEKHHPFVFAGERRCYVAPGRTTMR